MDIDVEWIGFVAIAVFMLARALSSRRRRMRRRSRGTPVKRPETHPRVADRSSSVDEVPQSEKMPPPIEPR